MRRFIGLAVVLMVLLGSVAGSARPNSDVETELFLKAKSSVYARKWETARTGLEEYLDRYPSGRFEEEARYWLARTLSQLSKGKDASSAVELRENAVKLTDEILGRRPKSRWSGDAMALKAELAADLAAAGRKPYLKFLEGLAGTKDKDESAMLLAATMILSEQNPLVGLALIERTLPEAKDPAVRKQMASFIAAYIPDLGLSTLRRMAETDPDASVRAETAGLVEHLEMEAIPVELIYYCYTARLSKDQNLIPEGKLNVYDFPAIRSAKNVVKEVKKHFHGKLSDVKLTAGRWSVRRARLPMLHALAGLEKAPTLENGWRLTQEIAGFRVDVPEEAVKKERLRISGQVSFFDASRDREYIEEFLVDDINGALMAMRRGDDVAILVLQFQSLEEPFDAPEENAYNMRFADVFGAVVSSSRKTWSMDELTGISRGNIVDFGRAKAEIPGADGVWILMGDIQIVGAERSFVGRDAVLYDPKRKIAAQASEITVPADTPSRFRVIEKGN